MASAETGSEVGRDLTVGFDGTAVGFADGTGTTTYARNLSHAAHAIGADVTVLYGQKVPRSSNDTVAEVSFFDTSDHPKGPLALKIERFARIAEMIRATFPMSAVATELAINDVVDRGPLSTRLPYFDRVVNHPKLYTKAQQYFRQTGRFLPVEIENPPEIFHWTHPMPLRIVNSRNVYSLLDLIPLRLPYTTLDRKSSYYKMVTHIARSADLITTISEFSRGDIVELLNPSCEVINTYTTNTAHDGVLAMTDAEVAHELSSGFDLGLRSYYLVVGRIEPRKNLKRLIEAYLAAGSPHPLVIVGPEGWLHSDELALTRLSHLGGFELSDDTWTPRQRVRRLSYLSFRQLSLLYRGARALVMPSLYEGFGLPPFEASLYGTPVIASDTTSLREIGGDAVTRVDPLSTTSIIDAIRTHDAGIDIDSIGARLRSDAERFSPDRHAELLRAAYETIL